MAASMPRRRQAAARAALALLLPVQLASAYTWSFQSKPTQCEDLSIKISGSDGKPPYRVLIVPYGPSPLDNNIEARRIVAEEADGDSDTITFQLKYPENSQFVAVVRASLCFARLPRSRLASAAFATDLPIPIASPAPIYYPLRRAPSACITLRWPIRYSYHSAGERCERVRFRGYQWAGHRCKLERHLLLPHKQRCA